MEPTISRATDVPADAGTVWSWVTDLPRMGELSPENIGGRWLDEPGLGARFRGRNRNGDLQWWTRVRVVAFEERHRFAFDVRTPIGSRVSRWEYVLTPTADGCRVTENWYRIGSWVVRKFMGPRVTGRADRPGYNVRSIEHTLAAIKARAEAQAAAA
ncbi:Polyketide cyclase / dehydrase and lipid transport [Amycolatopsis pretoriensis]|uniref:Polyketide cyclase / dehydrase and lipid transport n=1 Tax=Amycolatopsis pretoriensis TaxID=218821 RepID=A0A1H5Q3R6_9PSEU|nr:SRPBCC family protein [Amycolatopsis pretoriensis]SEF20750.1 Polyketide cyclase / dehydrase and lipid transport [Amycolatopsis pretoriensis]